MDDLKIRYSFYHEKHLISFDCVSDLPRENQHIVKRMIHSWEEQVRLSAGTHFLTKEISNEASKQIKISTKKESLPT
jgi:hypothetical protein